jgi:hypothetical protein
VVVAGDCTNVEQPIIAHAVVQSSAAIGARGSM